MCPSEYELPAADAEEMKEWEAKEEAGEEAAPAELLQVWSSARRSKGGAAAHAAAKGGTARRRARAHGKDGEDDEKKEEDDGQGPQCPKLEKSQTDSLITDLGLDDPDEEPELPETCVKKNGCCNSCPSAMFQGPAVQFQDSKGGPFGLKPRLQKLAEIIAKGPGCVDAEGNSNE